MSQRLSEVEVARPVVAHFAALGETFPEVVCWQAGDRADLVVRRADNSLDVVEVKVSPNMKLVRQVRCWAASAHRVWAAYQAPRRGAVSERWSERFRAVGVGVIHVHGASVTVRVPAQERVPSGYMADKLAGALSPLHRDYAEAGNAESQYLTAFKVTCDNLRDAIKARPGLTMKEAVAAISHHYSSDKSARSSLLAWIRAGKVGGVEARPIEGSPALGLYLTPAAGQP